MAGRGTWLFSFCSICGWRLRAFPCTCSGCWLCGLHLQLYIRIFYSSPQLLPATCLLCHFFSCESIVVTEAVGTALRTPPASLWGTWLLCLGHMGNLKKAAGMQSRICSSLSATHQNRCEQCVSVWCLSTSFLHLPGKLCFHQGKARITHRSTARVSLDLHWHDWSGLIITLGEKGSPNFFASSVGRPCRGAGVLALSLRADFHQQQEQTGISGTRHGVGTSLRS